MDKIVFLDRDGTINSDFGYVHLPEQLTFIPNSLEGLKILQKEGYRLFIVTNQSGIGRGYYTKDQFHQFNDFFLQKLTEAGIIVEKTFFCPHLPEDKCNCRKPKTMLVKNHFKSGEIDFHYSYVIGDKTTDLKFAENLGLKSILVLTGKAGKDESYNIKPTYTSNNLLEAAKIIIKKWNIGRK